jgi:hypothetical protein
VGEGGKERMMEGEYYRSALHTYTHTHENDTIKPVKKH